MAQAGKFRDYVTFQTLTDGDAATDRFGNAVDSWGGDFSRYADVRVTPGKERIEGGALTGVNMATMRVRSDSATDGIRAGDRVLFDGAYWAVESDPARTNRKGDVLELMIESGTAQ